MSKDLRELSRTNWALSKEQPNLEDINTGAILRIADATEKMAIRHTELIRDRDYYEREYRDRQRRVEELGRSNASLRGQITKLKRKLAAMSGKRSEESPLAQSFNPTRRG